MALPMPANGAPMVEWAFWLASLGNRVIPLTGKVPAIPKTCNKKNCKGACGKWGHGCHDGTTDPETISAMWAHYPNSNIGIALDEGEAVLDIDVRHDGMDSWIDLEHSYGELGPTVTCLTGSGGGSQHKKVRIPPGMKCKAELAPGIDIKTYGGYVVAPPSIHPDTGKPYVWESDYGPDDLEPIAAPEWLLALMRADRPTPNGTEPNVASNGHISRSINEPGAEKKRNIILTRLAGAMRRVGADAQEIIAALDAHNMKWDIPLDEEELVKIAEGIEGRYAPEPQMIVTKQNVPVGWIDTHANDPSNVTPYPIRPEQTHWWKEHLDPFTEKNGLIKVNNTTIRAILQYHPDWQGRLWWDDVGARMMLDEHEVQEHEITDIGADFGLKYRLPVSNDHKMMQSMVAVSRQLVRDPIQEYLRLLPGWDMQPRLETWLLDCAGIADTPYHRYCSRNLIVSMIARALDPGCICRSVLILEGPEEFRKSTFVASLVPRREWFDEMSGSLESKEAHMFVEGLWVAELSELDSIGRTEETRLKSFISLCVDAYVPKYRGLRVQHKRRTIFVGTTNDSVYFKGGGNTRFLPVKIVTPMEIERFVAIREQLYAEALVYYGDNPEQWWRMGEEATETANEERDQRRQASMIEDDFADWLYRRRFTPESKGVSEFAPAKCEVSWPEIATGYYGMLVRRDWKDSAYQREAQKTLKALGWYPGKSTTRKLQHAQEFIRLRLWECNPLDWPTA